MAKQSITDLREKVAHSEQRFLEGPRSRPREFRFAFKVFWEFITAFRKLHFIGPCVTVFGSARFTEEHPYYIKAREMGAEISKLGFTIITGGGPGIMEAANRGAFEVGGRSIGCNIMLPHEQSENPYVQQSIEFKYFFVRKTLLLKYSYAFVIMPGGWGTMDEMFEALTLIQTGKIKEFPVILFGREYWKHLISLTEDMVTNKTINTSEIKEYLLVTDSVEEAVEHLKKHAIAKFGLKRARRMRQRWWYGEMFTFKK
jgi:uncharacterized protein (TIGR00730 family)